MHIVDYLNKQARAASARSLPDFDTTESFEIWRKSRQMKFHQMLGIDTYLAQQRTPLQKTITGSVDCDTHRISKLHFQSLPGLYVTANLYVPSGLKEPAPAVLYLCGHHGKQKVHYQDHARRFAQEGFVTLVLDTIQLGEIRGVHHGTYAQGRFDWVSSGYTPAAVEVWNAIRGLDLLCDLDEVDPNRLGVTGHSGGGSISWWLTCADDRIKAMASSSGTGDLASHLGDRTLDYHCDCNFPNNPDGWSSAESYALAAPRPVLVVAPDRDRVFRIDSVQHVYDRLKALYWKLGHENKLDLCAFRAQHMYTPESRKRILSWFLTHLAHKDITPESVEDVDGVRVEEDQLLVYSGKPPEPSRVTTVQEWFIPSPPLPDIRTESQLETVKTNLLDTLRTQILNTIPAKPRAPSYSIEQEYWAGPSFARKFSFSPEADWRLEGELRGLLDTSKHPLAVCIRQSCHRKEEDAYDVLNGVKDDWLRGRIDVRGTGDSTWGVELNWHIRRAAALIGRTITEMRIGDTLCGLDILRHMPEVDSQRIILAGRGEAAVVSLLVALLDGGIDTVVLEDIPSTFASPDDPASLGEGIELKNMTRHADIPQLAALLWPAKIVVIGNKWDRFEWTEKVYDSLGKPGQLLHFGSREAYMDALTNGTITG
ncbi:acetylxylan esterase [Paenibacillus ginsengarvi]|uniref:Peptidase S9 prolyl oligopeptidase catalytic domain-containing protein n=1 Tax=Paenibacillus ginsengarvi TaxID=400777 RepID=A0A3B0BSM7_9BACL|nr:acetylxylan esterase [Paenibacillus ginsengarvi]RKN75902.1 hypothetical protein D7M11_25700 [Paenibacillus ginsengarvi]